MKAIIIVMLSLLVVSCKQSKTGESQIKLDGKYSVVDYRMTPEFIHDTVGRDKLMAILKSSTYKFDFSNKNSIVRIDPQFGMEYFGDSVFEYRIEHKFIALRNPDMKVNVPFRNDNGIIRLLIDQKGIEHFSIIPVKRGITNARLVSSSLETRNR
ncbi:hypothetical protein [Echinicola vietnamensis]|uniref:DUF4251 domain-containing protein n=1 Tax=Echinicola vietnamensis (strain DSM 17526 / LMG 23754 / KMM 6221) TaxID=926556 RepID=L0FYL4_ECHVK|nr:hypothetical protein [Echinicola vietnamensis]AGA78128.1 hypothetical protein Echvi_1873 [Echinicola vietnamensis DSM 17526]